MYGKKDKTFVVVLLDDETWDAEAKVMILKDDEIRKDYSFAADVEIINEIDDGIHLSGVPDFCIHEEISVEYLYDFYTTSRMLGLHNITHDVIKEKQLSRLVAP